MESQNQVKSVSNDAASYPQLNSLVSGLLLTILSLLAQPTTAQDWRASLYPESWSPPTDVDYYTDEFVQDFSYAGYHYGEREIPFITENIVDVTTAPYNADPTGTEDATAAIQQAMNDVGTAGGGVVFLPPGTYNVSVPDGETAALHLAYGNVVIRGAGTDQTFIFNTTTEMRLKAIIRVEAEDGFNWDRLPNERDFASMSRDLTGPTKEIPLDNPTLFSVGDEVVIRSLITDAWCDEHNEPDWKPFANILDGVINYRKVTGVTDSSITIDVPTRYAFLASDGAMVYEAQAGMLEEVGLEYFSIGNREIVAEDPQDWLDADGTLDNNGYRIEGAPAYETHASSALKIDRVRNSWVRNVSSYAHPDNEFGTHILSNGIKLEFSSHVTIDSVFMGYGQFGGGGGNNYGFRIESNECLIKNSSSAVARHGFSIVRIWSMGNVLHRVEDRTSGMCTANGPGLIKGGSSGSDFHQWYSPSNLIDQMLVEDSYFSAVHREGVSASSTRPGHDAVTAHSVFWNFRAFNSPNGYAIRTSQTKAGYVFGTSGNTPGVNNSPMDPLNLFDLSRQGTPPGFRYDPDGSITAPIDLVEGVNEGAGLVPQSLYLDQFSRRMDPSSTPFASGGPIVPALKIFPNPSGDGQFYLEDAIPYQVFDSQGRLLLSSSGDRVDLRGRPAGLYFLRASGVVSRLVIR